MRVLPESDPNLIYLYSEYKKIGTLWNLSRFSYYYNIITDGVDKYSTLIRSNMVDPKDLDCYSGSVDIDIIEFIDTYMKRINYPQIDYLLELRKTILRNRNLNDIMYGY